MLKISRKQVVFNIFGAILSGVLDFLSRKYAQKEIPQLVIFSHDHIGNRINVFGRYENDDLFYLESLIKSRKLGGGVCLDVGANIGNHALFFSDFFQQVHAFEPAQTPFNLLKINAALKNNIYCYQIGLSDNCATLKLSTPIDNIGMGSLSLTATTTTTTIVTDVNVKTLDSIESLQKIKIEIMKVDVEGHELAVITGASQTIKKNKPIILFEQQAEEFELGTSKVIEKLRSYGYTNFYCYSSWSRKFPRIIGVILRVIFGDTVTLTKHSVFEHKYYSMILAIND